MNLSLKSEYRPRVDRFVGPPRICVSVGVRASLSRIRNTAQNAIDHGADLVEIRLDYLEHVDVGSVRRHLHGLEDQLILTCRKKNEGGRFAGSDRERVDILAELAEWDGPLLDVELSTMQKEAGRFKSKSGNLIISWHDFQRTPRKQIMSGMVKEISQLGGVAKIITTAKNVKDNVTILSLYKVVERGSLIAFCMGEKGMISRLLSPMAGSPLTYTYIGRSPVAPGQFSLEEFRDLYGIMGIGT